MGGGASALVGVQRPQAGGVLLQRTNAGKTGICEAKVATPVWGGGLARGGPPVRGTARASAAHWGCRRRRPTGGGRGGGEGTGQGRWGRPVG